MCGLVGFTGSPNSKILEAMTRSIKHRGPDDDAFIVNPHFSIGFRRLAIIDLTENIYPIENERKSIELILNGEIYNYKSLRKELIEKGHVFETDSDSETIVHGYEEWGYDVLNHLRGMFVIALLDKEKNELFIARDRLGIKPFYYSKLGDRLIFGSEIKGLLKEFDISRKPEKKSIYRFLANRIHDIDESTFFQSIKRLLPGHFMVIKEDSSFEIEKYWKPSFNPSFKSEKSDDEYAAEFRDVFEEAVGLHLISDVPVGVTLSGGLDSSGITSLSTKLYNSEDTPNPLVAFSAVHPGESIDESEYIDEVVNFTGIESVKITPNVDNFWEELETWLYYQEEPVISGAPYAYYTVMREARRHVTVLLSGQGGDELLAGYVPYFMTYLHSALDNKKLWEMVRETWMGKDLYFNYFMKKLKSRSEESFNPKEMLDPKFRAEMQDYEFDASYSRNLNERLFEDVTRLTTPSLLRYEDKNSMAHSLESRVPFFDHKVVEHIFNLPIDQKIKFGWNRYVYRQAMKGILPEKIRKRRSKVGFTNPEWEWIERRADKFRAIFSSNSFIGREYWDAKKVQTEFEAALSGEKTGDLLIFWRFFITEMWLRSYVDKVPSLP